MLPLLLLLLVLLLLLLLLVLLLLLHRHLSALLLLVLLLLLLLLHAGAHHPLGCGATLLRVGGIARRHTLLHAVRYHAVRPSRTAAANHARASHAHHGTGTLPLLLAAGTNLGDKCRELLHLLLLVEARLVVDAPCLQLRIVVARQA